MTKPEKRNGTTEPTVSGRTTTMATEVGAQVQTAAGDAAEAIARRAPSAAAGSRRRLEIALANLRRRSTGSLAMGTVFVSGMTGGMLLSGAPRVLVALAFLPAVLFGATIVGRATTDGVPSREGHT